jgi:mono/diheme cytochrome c family protein
VALRSLGEVLGTPTPLPMPALDPARVSHGQEVYQQFCASCHGINGEGQPNWQQRNPDGTFPAPPHTDDGHTWHHADGLLFRIIRDGQEDLPGFKSAMPAFGDQLSDTDIAAVIIYLKSLWSEEIRHFQWEASQQDPFPTTP